MKKLFLIPCLLLLAYQCFAQATEKVVKDSLVYREKFSVLKSDPKIKQGDYMLMMASSSKILTTGSYKNNKKDGVWRDYDFNDRVSGEGHYQNGEKIGEWKFYTGKWQLANTYDFTKHQLIFHDPTKADSNNVYKVVRAPHDTISTKLEYGPIYLSGDYVRFRPLLNNSVAPPEAVKNHISGRVFVSFVVDENGHSKDFHLDSSLGYGCDEEALRLVKSIPDDWVPGRLKGKNVAVVMVLPVAFNFRK